ncbi:PAS domain S-box protein [Trinickia dinghuensis]|uniref:PAS domain S-box protein n=1 Tax=Trinickia dinghuensis TaxID=2291023 RepID=A0A3D8JYA2_9BURK|nr:PAS domain S-box protein [Trinickia dinghuensis]RDU97792.1 PAS domain S-box protein [Trinickia dinghuensis]
MPAAGNSSSPHAPPGSHRRPGESLRAPVLAATATALIVFIAAAVSALIVHDHLLRVAQENFDARAAHVDSDIRRELLLCTQLLRGASGLVVSQSQNAGDATPTPDAWDRYVSRLDLDDSPPCVRSLGYATAGAPAGASGAAPGGAPAHTVLMWPPRGDTSDGGELGVSDATRAALMRAANSSEVAMAIRELPRESGGTAQRGEGQPRARVDLYLPVYRTAPPPTLVPARRAALIGFAFGRLDTEYLFASISAHEPRMTLRVSGGQPAMMLYPPGAPLEEQYDGPERFKRIDTLHFGGEALTIAYATSDPTLAASADFSSSAIVAAGFAAAVIAAAAVFIFVRKRGTTLAEAGMARARSSQDEARLMAIIRSSSEAIVTTDEQQRIVMFNPAAEQVLRCSAMDAIGTSIDRFIPERFRAEHRRHVERFGETGVTERKMGRQQPVLVGLRADGEEFPIEASISQIHDGRGKLYTVMLRDVTERVRSEDALKASRQELRALSANLQSVREDEKTRIARELHDDLGQQLTALKMDLSSVEQSLGELPSAPAPVLAQLITMRRLIDSTVGSVRRIAADLRPVMLDDLGLLPAIDWLLTDFRTRYGIEIERRIEPGQAQFSRNGATTLFRIVQEALTNVARHAEATRVSIAFVVEDDQCLLRIEDNGCGAPGGRDKEGNGEKSFGLLGIRERVHILGGSVSIDTAAKQGFKLTVRVPLAAIQQEEALP